MSRRSSCCNNMFSPISVHYFISKAHALFPGSHHIQICLCQSEFLLSPQIPVQRTRCLRTSPPYQRQATRRTDGQDWSPLIPPPVKCKRVLFASACRGIRLILLQHLLQSTAECQGSSSAPAGHGTCCRHWSWMPLKIPAYGSLPLVCTSLLTSAGSSVFFTSRLSDGAAAPGEVAACPAPLLARVTQGAEGTPSLHLHPNRIICLAPLSRWLCR